jgi:hypothetical protein
MSTNTYVALDTKTLVAAVPSVTFTSIPQGYTDLVIVIAGTSSTSAEIYCQFNGDTGSNYSRTFMYGDGGSAVSGRNSSGTAFSVGFRGTNQSVARVNIMNYSNTTTYKTVLARSDAADIVTVAEAALWRSTVAINSVYLYSGSGTFSTGSTFTIYGVAAASVGAKATGGAIYSDSNYYYHVFGSNGTFTPSQTLSCDVLVAAGGGGGGYDRAAGGGAGGFLYQSGRSATSGTSYSITVGSGGSGATSYAVGGSGTNSTFDTITGNGGGGGGSSNPGVTNGASGGSGGGGSGQFTAPGGSATQGNSGGATGYGNAGGTGSGIPASFGALGSGGGGGAGAAGQAGNDPGTGAGGGYGGAGGVGLTYTTISALDSFGAATGTGQLSNGHYYYAGGGGGGANSSTNPGAGGLGGGGAAGNSGHPAGYNGATSTGGGGGGGNGGLGNGGNGGSGVVIVRYVK